MMVRVSCPCCTNMGRHGELHIEKKWISLKNLRLSLWCRLPLLLKKNSTEIFGVTLMRKQRRYVSKVAIPAVVSFFPYSLSRFLSGGMILGTSLSCTDLFLYTITLPRVSRDASTTFSHITLEMATRVLLSCKKPPIYLTALSAVHFLSREIPVIDFSW
jgi:hypothetical protein